jgi:hypothetical protein
MEHWASLCNAPAFPVVFDSADDIDHTFEMVLDL